MLNFWKRRCLRRSLLDHIDAELKQLGSAFIERSFRRKLLTEECSKLRELRLRAVAVKTIGELETVRRSVDALVERALRSVRDDAGVRQRVESAIAARDAVSGELASVPGSSLRSRLQSLRDKMDRCLKQLRRAKSSEAEGVFLRELEQIVKDLLDIASCAKWVTREFPAVREALGAVPKESVYLGSGTEELYREMTEVFNQAEKAVVRGDYYRAKCQLQTIRHRHNILVQLLHRRSAAAREEIDLWLATPSVASVFPELTEFPRDLDSDDIERWFEFRIRIHEHVADRAERQRQLNIPSRYPRSGRAVPRNHALRMSLEEACDENKLTSFLRGVRFYMQQLIDNGPN